VRHHPAIAPGFFVPAEAACYWKTPFGFSVGISRRRSARSCIFPVVYRTQHLECTGVHPDSSRAGGTSPDTRWDNRVSRAQRSVKRRRNGALQTRDRREKSKVETVPA